MMTGLQGREVFQSSTGWLPIESTLCPGLVVMSIGFLLTNPKEAVAPPPPSSLKSNSAVAQFCVFVICLLVTGDVARAQEELHHQAVHRQRQLGRP